MTDDTITDEMVEAACMAFSAAAGLNETARQANVRRAAMAVALRASRAVEAERERVSKWIACGDRMPYEDIDMLVVIDDRFVSPDRIVTMARWDGDESWWSDEQGIEFPNDVVTHWMGLPKPPQEGER